MSGFLSGFIPAGIWFAIAGVLSIISYFMDRAAKRDQSFFEDDEIPAVAVPAADVSAAEAPAVEMLTPELLHEKWSALKARRARKAAEAAEREEQNQARIERANNVRKSLQYLDERWLEYESDPDQYCLKMPALRNQSIPVVKAYHDALFDLRERVSVLDGSKSLDEDQVVKGEAAEKQALSSWDAARDYARKVGISELPELQARALRRIRSAAEILSDPVASRGERDNAMHTIEVQLRVLEDTPLRIDMKKIVGLPAIRAAGGVPALESA